MIQTNEKQKRQKIVLPKDLTMEQLIAARANTNEVISELQEVLDGYNQELLTRLGAEGLTSKVVGRTAITKVRRVTFATTLEEAKEFGAIKQAVDSDILRGLFDKGIDIPGTRISEYVTVKNIEKKAKDEK